MKDVLLGSVAGCVATFPMTWAMEALHRRLPPGERYPLPPRKVTMRLAEQAGVEDELDEEERLGLTLLAHFGMGTAMGALYGPLSRRLPLPAPLAGAAFGLAVWAGNYLGLLPALGLLRPATEHPPRRTALMVAAHLVWGVSAGLALEAMRGRD
jgi:hypothetical protein